MVLATTVVCDENVFTVIRFFVNVPVLSEHIVVAFHDLTCIKVLDHIV